MTQYTDLRDKPYTVEDKTVTVEGKTILVRQTDAPSVAGSLLTDFIYTEDGTSITAGGTGVNAVRVGFTKQAKTAGWMLNTAVAYLAAYNQYQRTVVDADQATLDAEALTLHNAYWDLEYSSVAMLTSKELERWRTIARRVRESTGRGQK